MLLHASLLATRAPWPVVGAALLLAMALLAGAARSGAAETVAEEIGRAETRFAAALGGDWRDLEDLLADDFVYNTAEVEDGKLKSVTGFLDKVPSGA